MILADSIKLLTSGKEKNYVDVTMPLGRDAQWTDAMNFIDDRNVCDVVYGCTILKQLVSCWIRSFCAELDVLP